MERERGERVLLKKPRTVDEVAAGITDLQVVFGALDFVVFADLSPQLRRWDISPRFHESFQVCCLTLERDVRNLEQVLAQHQPHAGAANQFGEQENRELPHLQSRTAGKPLHAPLSPPSIQ